MPWTTAQRIRATALGLGASTCSVLEQTDTDPDAFAKRRDAERDARASDLERVENEAAERAYRDTLTPEQSAAYDSLTPVERETCRTMKVDPVVFTEQRERNKVTDRERELFGRFATPAGMTEQLSATDRAMCKQLGLDPAKFLATKRARVKGPVPVESATKKLSRHTLVAVDLHAPKGGGR